MPDINHYRISEAVAFGRFGSCLVDAGNICSCGYRFLTMLQRRSWPTTETDLVPELPEAHLALSEPADLGSAGTTSQRENDSANTDRRISVSLGMLAIASKRIAITFFKNSQKEC